MNPLVSPEQWSIKVNEHLSGGVGCKFLFLVPCSLEGRLRVHL